LDEDGIQSNLGKTYIEFKEYYRGKQGLDGEKGETGKSTKLILSSVGYIEYELYLAKINASEDPEVFKFTDTGVVDSDGFILTNVDVKAIVGPRGQKGDEGASGPPGPRGKDGAGISEVDPNNLLYLRTATINPTINPDGSAGTVIVGD
jgi:hypothetical protein